jgi:hypothetical protein
MFTERESWAHAGLEYFLAKFHRNLQRKDFSAGTSDEKMAALSLLRKLMQKRIKLRFKKRTVHLHKQNLCFLNIFHNGEALGKH